MQSVMAKLAAMTILPQRFDVVGGTMPPKRAMP